MEEPIKLQRDCEAIQIPDGFKVTLTAGMGVRISQALGGSYTVLTEWGSMLRIDAKDADALGKTAEVPQTKKEEQSLPLETRVWNELKSCYDPEIPVNIVDLGLIYVCKVVPLESGKNKVEIRFTLTAPGCGMGDVLRSDIEYKVKQLSGVDEADIQVVLDPPWDRSMMSEAAKLHLGMF